MEWGHRVGTWSRGTGWGHGVGDMGWEASLLGTQATLPLFPPCAPLPGASVLISIEFRGGGAGGPDYLPPLNLRAPFSPGFGVFKMRCV